MDRLCKYRNTSFLIPQEKRLGEFPPTKNALRLFFSIALPSIAELVFVSLISSIDLMMVGSLGNYAISAVGLCGQPVMLAICLFWALNVGVTATVSRRKGQGDREGAVRALRQTLFVEFFAAAAMTGLMLGISRPLLRFSGAIEGETLDPAVTYFCIIMSFFVFRVFMLTINAALRGVGETATTLVTNVVSNVVNIIFNYLLIGGRLGFPKLGIAGAAIASGIGFFVAFLIALYSATRKKSYLCFSFKESFLPDRETLKPMLKVSSNAVLEQFSVRIGFFLVAKFAADLGTDEFAAHSILNQILNITFNIGDGLAVATTTLVGQNLGRRRSDISEMYCKLSERCALIIALCTCSLIISLRHIIPTFFTDDPKVISLVSLTLIPMGITSVFQLMQVIYAGTLRGAGDTKSVAISSTIAICGIRTVCSGIAVYLLDSLMFLWIFMIIDQVFRFVFLNYRFRLGKWKQVKV